MSKLKTATQNSKLFIFTLLLCVLTFILYTSPAYAACDVAAQLNLPVEDRSPDCPAGLDQIEDLVGNVIFVAVGLGFIAMLILLIMAGFKYLTSGGEPKAIQSAHHTVTWALLGLLFMAIAWLILQLLSAFTGIDVTIFDIKKLCGGVDLPFCKN